MVCSGVVSACAGIEPGRDRGADADATGGGATNAGAALTVCIGGSDTGGVGSDKCCRMPDSPPGADPVGRVGGTT